MIVIGQAAHKVKWVCPGYYRRDRDGVRVFVFADASPYPGDGDMYGVAESLKDCGFSGDCAPVKFRSAAAAFEFANGRD